MDEIARIRQKIDNMPAYHVNKCNRPDLHVACIMDTFSYECFKYECFLVQLRSDSWKQQLEALQPHFLLVESAWRGIDDSWRNLLTDRINVAKQELWSLIEFCKKNKIPTVFWNKEDPVNYPIFIETAKLFDYIFTTDENCVKRYVQDAGHQRVYPLPFAAQPAIHNPVSSSYLDKENVAFAGTWYVAKHPERQEDMNLILRPAKEFGLHIFDRMFTFNGNTNYKFPEEYEPFIMGGLNYADMLKAYKLYKVFLNVNSVKDSPTMFSRRVFELLASGANLISTYSKGIELTFGHLIPFAFSIENVKAQLSVLLNNSEYSQRLSLLGIREIHQKHLYKHRFHTILEKIGLPSTLGNDPGVSVIVYSNIQSMDQLLDYYMAQTWKNKELIILLRTQENISSSITKATETYPHVSIVPVPQEVSFGDSINLAVNHARYNFVTFFHDNDYYGPNFITDLMYAFNYTDADIVGKGCYYIYYENKKNLILTNTNRENQFIVSGSYPAMIVKKQVFKMIKFTNDPDQGLRDFQSRCHAQGYKLYSADKYNYVQINKKAKEEYIYNTEDYKSFVVI